MKFNLGLHMMKIGTEKEKSGRSRSLFDNQTHQYRGNGQIKIQESAHPSIYASLTWKLPLKSVLSASSTGGGEQNEAAHSSTEPPHHLGWREVFY